MRISDWSSDVCSSDLNVLYHFESAAGLQSALMASMIDDLVTALGDAVAQIKSDDGAPFTIVNRVFDAFDGGGAGPLAAWIVLSRGFSHLERSEERRVGKECVITFGSRGSPYH